MKVPDNTVFLVKTFEGFRPKPYLCPAGIPTIGYGSTMYPDGKRVTLKDSPVDEETAISYMEAELEKCLKQTIRICPVLAGFEKRLGAVVDFVYNLGSGRLATSTLRRKINAGLWEDVPHELEKWCYGGGRKLRGLLARRKAEAVFIN